MRTLVAIALSCALAHISANDTDQAILLASVLEHAGERVERYFARAQSIICLEIVHLQPLTPQWSTDGFGRTIESELRLSWGAADGQTPNTEARSVRQLLKVNGRQPRKDDTNNCTTPEQESEEPHALSLLLPSQREGYQFSLAGPGRVDRRSAIMVDFRLVKRAAVESHMVEGRDDCVSFNIEGGMRGRIWIDAESHDVLRLDQSLRGLVEIPLPAAARRRASSPTSWTMERWDTSIRFKQVTFTDPEETLVLPESLVSLTITRGAGTPRLRTMTQYRNYKRFLTGGRVVGG